MSRRIHACALLLAATSLLGVNPAFAGYAMYVWTEGFDATVAGCDEAKLIAWDKAADPECYTHNWETPVSRQWLWDTANRPGREVERLFVSDIKARLEPAYLAGDCSDPDVVAIRQMLIEGHCKVPGVRIHALFATSDAAVSEQFHVPYVVWYNDTCAGGANARFDGIAVNNEAWSSIKCTTPPAEQAYLDDLQAVVDAADLQVTGTLETHYSIGWHWGQCGGVDTDVDWNGTMKPATHHMIDIFDTVDVQIAHVSVGTAASRAITAGYGHAIGQGKTFYVLSYTNRTDPGSCTATHFPYFCSFTWSNSHRTDAYMTTQIFDEYPANGIPFARPGIHYFRGVYSTGGHADWPSYYSGSVAFCLPMLHGLVEFANPDDDDEITWPAQADATVYEIARYDGSPIPGTTCKIAGTTPQTTFVDPERPRPGEVYSYLVRVLAPQPGSWGQDSAGTDRTVSCP